MKYLQVVQDFDLNPTELKYMYHAMYIYII